MSPTSNNEGVAMRHLLITFALTVCLSCGSESSRPVKPKEDDPESFTSLSDLVQVEVPIQYLDFEKYSNLFVIRPSNARL